jgi:hypothetical protein
VNHAEVYVFLGSLIALAGGVFTAFLPGFAYITVPASQSTFNVAETPHFLSYPLLIFGVHDLTIKLLVIAVGGLLGVFSFFERKNSIPILSFAGLSVAMIGFVLPSQVKQSFAESFNVDIPWIGYFVALTGALLMFTGFALANRNVPKKAFVTIPLLLAAYFIAPALILTNNSTLFILLETNITLSTVLGLTILFSHLLIIWAAIKGLHLPEK